MNDVFSFGKEEMKRDSLECAGLELQVWRQKILLITDQIIYEVWDCILQEPVVRHSALILEKCLLRASSLGDKQRQIPRKEEHELAEEPKGKQKLSGVMSILGLSMCWPSLSYEAKVERGALPHSKALVTARTKIRRTRKEVKRKRFAV